MVSAGHFTYVDGDLEDLQDLESLGLPGLKWGLRIGPKLSITHGLPKIPKCLI